MLALNCRRLLRYVVVGILGLGAGLQYSLHKHMVERMRTFSPGQGLRKVAGQLQIQDPRLAAPAGVLMHKAPGAHYATMHPHVEVAKVPADQAPIAAATIEPDKLPATLPLLSDIPVPDASAGAITSFVQRGEILPIIMLTHQRPDMLRKTITSLLAVRGVKTDRIFVMQHGKERAALDVIAQYKLKVFVDEHVAKSTRPQQNVGAIRIAQHYKFALTTAFTKAAPTAPAVIVVEDDLLFSPDFLEYFTATAPLLEADESVSAEPCTALCEISTSSPAL
jgi:hypothetical protein